MSNHHWTRTRFIAPLHSRSGEIIGGVLGERDDGGVFFQFFLMTSPVSHMEQLSAAQENAKFMLDFFLNDPLVPESVGQFDVEPNFYIPGMSPAKI